ncbi:hypothetical protein BGZ68_008250 [Mortierella alpina]|nr:hypothetical protein BGZ68_008250 [Mortierella alpina]
MPEQTDKRRSWWGILAPADRSPQPNANARSSQPDLFANYAVHDGNYNNRMFDANTDPDYASPAFEGTGSESDAGNGPSSNGNGSQSLRRVSSKLDLFKKPTLPKRGKSKGASKFATITTAWSSSRSTLPGRTTMGSVSSTTVDLNHYEKASLADLDDAMVFSVAEQPGYIEGERERDVAYTIRAEGNCKIIVITRRISEFLELDEKASAQDEDFNIVRRDTVPKVRGSRIRPGLPQIQERKKASIEDYELIKVLGKGCMGKVMLVREYRSKNLFALKAISKEWVILQREIEHTKSERNILANVARISHPFLIKLRHSFQSNAQLFMVLDYYPGGDIATQLTKWHRFDPERCLFYAAEIVLGIEELHRLGIVYRDLKPENILLALDGHIVLTDFGLSKQFPTFSAGGDKTNTFCGTAEYLAPEILRAAEYSYAVDWWSLGTLLYEMLTGITPFWAENHAQMYQRVLEDELEFPPEMDHYAMSFIAGLLERDPDHRLGSQGAAYVKDHPYFDLVDWELAIQKKLPCPYIPELLSEEDLSNFDDTFLTMTPRLSPGNHTLSKSIQNCFQGYSYTDKLATTLPRNDSKIRLDQRSRGPSSDAYIDGFDQDAPPTKVEGNGHGHANGQHQAQHRTPWQEMGYQEQSLESDSEEEDFYEYRPMTQLYAPPSAAILGHIETKAQATSPALTPPTAYPEDGRMPVERISTSRMGAAADILRGYSERSSIDTHRHNSTGSSHSSGTIGRRLSRGYI